MRGGAISRTASSIIAAADPELKLCAYDSRVREHDTQRPVSVTRQVAQARERRLSQTPALQDERVLGI